MQQQQQNNNLSPTNNHLSMFFNNSLNAVQSNPSCANMQKSMTNSTINTNINGGSSSFYQNNGLAESSLHGGGGLGAVEK